MNNSELALKEIGKQITSNVYAKEVWNAAIQRCMDLLEANRKISERDKENLSYAMRREKKC